MSSEDTPAVAARELSKSYRIFARPQDRLKQALRRRRPLFREFWALKNVSFEIRKGETIGVIGRNGSGKSTLLQLVAGTLTPSGGEVRVRGRVAALLELGSGFNPEFTGRENVFMNGSILGLTRGQIQECFEEIVDFAEVGSFIDQPVKTYSSGMTIRLAFAVQAVVPKDILIVDEALAVGDEAYQRKCFAKIREFQDRGGTILLVSHAPGFVVDLCDRAFLLDDGELILEGGSKSVINLYQRLVHAPAMSRARVRAELQSLGSAVDASAGGERDGRTSPDEVRGRGDDVPFDPALTVREPVQYESKGATIREPRLTTLDGRAVNHLRHGETYLWRYRVTFRRPAGGVRFSMMIKTLTGYELGGAAASLPGEGRAEIRSGTSVDVAFRFRANLNVGTYSLNAGVVGDVGDGEEYLDRHLDAALFKMLPPGGESLRTGIVDFEIEPRLVPLDEPEPTAEVEAGTEAAEPDRG